MLESEALEGNVGDLVEGDERRGEFGDNDRVRRQRGGGIEINATGFAVEIPLAGLIEFLEDVEVTITLVGGVTVARVRLGNMTERLVGDDSPYLAVVMTNPDI